MRTHIDTHPDFDFAIGYKRPEARKAKITLCEDCRTRPARRNSVCCLSCGRSRERIATSLMGTLGAPFVP